MINEWNETQFNESVGKKVCMVDYYSTSCGPCRTMLPTLEKLSGEFEIAKVNVYENTDLASKQKISAVPTFIFYKDGKEAARLTGIQTEAKIRETFGKLANT